MLSVAICVCLSIFGATQTKPPQFSELPDVGRLNEKAIKLPIPAYPMAARNKKICGPVKITVTVNRKGNVAKAVVKEGHREISREALHSARRATFDPLSLEFASSRYVIGTLEYNFDCMGLNISKP